MAGGRVVVGVSPSLAGLAALRFGVAEAERRQAHLCAVRAWYLNPSFDQQEGRLWRDRLSEEAMQTILDAFEAAMGGTPDDVDVTMIATPGRVDQALTRVAAGRDDLLVLGGRSGALSTSWVVRYCMRRAGCPVVVVPPPELAGTVKRRGLVRALIQDVERYAEQF